MRWWFLWSLLKKILVSMLIPKMRILLNNFLILCRLHLSIALKTIWEIHFIVLKTIRLLNIFMNRSHNFDILFLVRLLNNFRFLRKNTYIDIISFWRLSNHLLRSLLKYEFFMFEKTSFQVCVNYFVSKTSPFEFPFVSSNKPFFVLLF